MRRVVGIILLGIAGLVAAIGLTLGALALAGDEVGAVVQPNLAPSRSESSSPGPSRDDHSSATASPSTDDHGGSSGSTAPSVDDHSGSGGSDDAGSDDDSGSGSDGSGSGSEPDDD